MSSEKFEREYSRKFFDDRDIKYAIQSIAREIKIQRKSSIFPDLVTIDDVKAIIKEYRDSVTKWLAHKITDHTLPDELVQKLNMTPTIRKSAITRNSWFDAFDADNRWYRSQYEALHRLECSNMTSYMFNALTRTYTYKKMRLRFCDMITVMPDGKTVLEHTINSIVKSIKTLDDFVEFSESNILDILPLSQPIKSNHTDMTVYKDVFKRIGAYYTLQNMIMFHHFDGMTMEQLNDIANNAPENLWGVLKTQIDDNNLMDYLVPTQIDEC